MFVCYFRSAFPLKLVQKRDNKYNSWISRGIKVSCQKMKLLNKLKHKMCLSRDALFYIKRYHRIYKRVISEAKKRHNDKQIICAINPTKMMWQLINNKMRNSEK
jgi:hypothetical protein